MSLRLKPARVAPFKSAFALACVLCCPSVQAQNFGVDDNYLSTHRMGAFQCLRCPKGGFIEGIRSGDQGRVRREFSSIQDALRRKICVCERSTFVYFNLDDRAWPEDGSWSLKANSWNAECSLR